MTSFNNNNTNIHINNNSSIDAAKFPAMHAAYIAAQEFNAAQDAAETHYANPSLADDLAQHLATLTKGALLERASAQASRALNVPTECARKWLISLLHVLVRGTSHSAQGAVSAEHLITGFLRETHQQSNPFSIKLALTLIEAAAQAGGLLRVATHYTVTDAPVSLISLNCYIPCELLAAYARLTLPMPSYVIPQATKTSVGYRKYNRQIISRGLVEPNHADIRVLNVRNQVPYSINTEILPLISPILGKLSGIHTQEYTELYKRTTGEMLTSLVQQGNRFYFAHYYDFRGRSLPVAYHINICGDSTQKAMIHFADSHEVSNLKPNYTNDLRFSSVNRFTDMQHLLIALGADLGMGKLSFWDRIETVQEYILGERDLPLNDALAVSASLEAKRLQDSWSNNKPHVSQYMCRFDASSSMLQILGAISGCEETLYLTGLIGNEVGLVYDTLIDSANSKLSSDKQISLSGDSGSGITRDDVKTAIIARGYGATKSFSSLFPDNEEQAAALEDSYAANLPCVRVFSQELESIMESGIDSYEWTLPDGFTVAFKVSGSATHMFSSSDEKISGAIDIIVNGYHKGFRGLLANYTHSIEALICREMLRRVSYDESLLLDFHYAHQDTVDLSLCDGKYVSLDLLHTDTSALDAVTLANLYQVVTDCLEFKSCVLSTNHDCFAAPAHGVAAVRFHYKEIISSLVRMDIANYILKQVMGESYTYTHVGDLEQCATLISEFSHYALR